MCTMLFPVALTLWDTLSRVCHVQEHSQKESLGAVDAMEMQQPYQDPYVSAPISGEGLYQKDN